MLDITFAPAELPTAGALVLLVAEGGAPGGLRQALDDKSPP